MSDKKDIKSKLILLSGNSKVNKDKEKQVKLTPEELIIKARLIEIEKQIDSLEKIVETITKELPETFYSSDIFMTIIAGAALSAATKVVNESFGIKGDEEDNNPLF